MNYADEGAKDWALPVERSFVGFSLVQANFDNCLQDSSTRNLLQFNSHTGDYRFTNCESGFTLSGMGVVTRLGCVITLKDTPLHISISASVNTCGNTGSAVVKVFTTVETTFTITDRSTGNRNGCGCSLLSPPLPEPKDNLVVGTLSLLDGVDRISVIVPLRISSRGGPASVKARFVLTLVGNTGSSTKLADGTMSVTSPDDQSASCTGEGDACTGSCPDMEAEFNWIQFLCLFIPNPGANLDCLFFYKDPPVPSQCGSVCSFLSCGPSCGCTGTTEVLLGPYPRSQLSPGSVLVFQIDPDAESAEFDKSDNIGTVVITPHCQ